MKPLRIGVICEGPTDFHAIYHFMKPALRELNIDASIIDIQPDMGRTLQCAGWGNIELWLKNNPPKLRMTQYFGGGPFLNNLSAKACDIFLIQMDSDIIDDKKFRRHMINDYNYGIQPHNAPNRRGQCVAKVLELWSKFEELDDGNRRRHVVSPAVESTEAWCVAAFSDSHQKPEELNGSDLITAFMAALEESEGRSIQAYSKANKDVKRRERFCKKHANDGYKRIVQLCPHFDRALEMIRLAADCRN